MYVLGQYYNMRCEVHSKCTAAKYANTINLTHMTEELPLKSRSAGTTVAVFMPPYAAASEALRRAIEQARAEGMTRIQVHRGNKAAEQAARELGFQRHEDYLSLLLLEDTLATEHCTISEFEFLRFKFELKQFYEEVRLLCGRNGAMLGPQHTVYIARDEGRNLVCGAAYVDKQNYKGVWSIDVLCSSVRGMDKVLFDHIRRAAHADNIVLTILPNDPLDEEERALYKSWGTHRISSKGYVMFPRPKHIIDTKNQHGFPLPPFVIRADSVDGAFLRRLVLDKYPDATTITLHFWGAGTPPAEVVDGTMYNTARMDYIKIGVPTMIEGPTLRRQNAERDLFFLRKERSEWEHRHDFLRKLEAYEEQLAYEKSIGDKGFGPEYREFERKFQELDRAHTELIECSCKKQTRIEKCENGRESEREVLKTYTNKQINY